MSKAMCRGWREQQLIMAAVGVHEQDKLNTRGVAKCKIVATATLYVGREVQEFVPLSSCT